MGDRSIKVYLWLLLVSLPMDWFGPTGALLREAGAKPAVPLMMSAALAVAFARRQNLVKALPLASWLHVSRFFWILLCGLVAFVLNLVFRWSQFGGGKNPVTQFLSQAALFVLTPLLIVVHAELFRDRRWPEYMVQILPWVVLLHLLALALELIGVFRYDHLPLSLFRTGSEAVGMRTAGLFSEPSYFATMAALYGVPLLLVPRLRGVGRCRAIALLLFAAALYTGGKTVIPVTLFSVIGFVWYSRTRLFTLRNLGVVLVGVVVAATIIVSQSALDVRDNLSSAMRFGSTLTSVNVALAGYGITGVGFGQFHFLYQKSFMPSFLLFSEEALLQLASSAEHRTSTYNIFTRYLVETGVTGLLLFLLALRHLFVTASRDRQLASLLGVLLLSASIGFLLTQEPYCYPPLILGAALILGVHHSRQHPHQVAP